MKPDSKGSIPVGDEQVIATGVFAKGDYVEVMECLNDEFCNFIGTVVGLKGNEDEGIIVQVKDQDDNVWDVDEHQCSIVDQFDFA